MRYLRAACLGFVTIYASLVLSIALPSALAADDTIYEIAPATTAFDPGPITPVQPISPSNTSSTVVAYALLVTAIGGVITGVMPYLLKRREERHTSDDDREARIAEMITVIEMIEAKKGKHGSKAPDDGLSEE